MITYLLGYLSNSLYKYNFSNFNQIGGSIGFALNGMPNSISVNYSQTNGERRVVDSPTTFIIGDGSNLKVGKVENTAGAIGATGSGKLSIDEYIGHNLENVDKSKTVGGSVGISTSGINSIGINYNDRKQEGITKNTVIGNVEIGKSSGAEINKDLGSMTEITKDRDFKTDINIESQTINYAKNPEDLKFKKYYREEILPKDPNYKKVKFLVSMGTNMIPGVGEVKLGIEMFVGEDLLTKEKYNLTDIIQTTTMLSKNNASRGMNKLENQLSDSKNSQKFQLIKTELDTRNQKDQNGQQHQRGQDNLVQNNKNDINKTQAQGNQDYPNNQQVSKKGISNNQQEAPISKTSVINGKSSVAALDVIQKDTSKLKSINLSKLEVVENSTPKEANLFWKEKAGYTNDPYDENYEVKLVKNNGKSFVRVYTASKKNKASAWFMREKDIIGLTPEEIKDKFALPYTPTHVVDVKIGNITIRTGIVKEVESWGKGKGQQFDANGTHLNEEQFVNEREIGERYERK